MARPRLTVKANDVLRVRLFQSQRNNVKETKITMPRELSEKDIGILKKLAPECDDLTCSGSGHMFHSILPPVSNHFAEDSEDYTLRINRLSDDELIYLVEMIQKGEESMGCLPVEDVDAFVHLVHDRISPEMAQKVISTYEGGGECQH
jgi:hypothetical protein